MDLNKLRKDIEEGIRQGIVYVEKGVALVKEKAEELTDEGKKQYRMYELKTKLQKDIASLGSKVYSLTAAGSVKPVHADVQKLISRIAKAENDLAKIEGKAQNTKKAPAKKAAAKKPAAKKTAPKKKPAAAR